MTFSKLLPFLSFIAIFPLLFAGCESPNQPRTGRTEDWRLKFVRDQARDFHNTYRTEKNWRNRTYRNGELLKGASPENTRIEISIKEQRGFLLVNEAIAMDFPVATGKSSHPTPTGRFTILDKQKDYTSNLYGRIYDANGLMLLSDADRRTDPIPAGAKFVGASMPYWMRLTTAGVGLHVGYVPGRPASHGCVRLTTPVAAQLFALTKVGTVVEIADQAPCRSAASADTPQG